MQVLLGISHNGGYAPFIDEILGDHKTHARVSIIEGVPVAPEYAETQVWIVRLEGHLFRAETLRQRGTPQLSEAPLVSPDHSGTSSRATDAGQPPATSSSYATAAAARPATSPPKVTFAFAPKPAKSPRPIGGQNWNPGPRGSTRRSASRIRCWARFRGARRRTGRATTLCSLGNALSNQSASSCTSANRNYKSSKPSSSWHGVCPASSARTASSSDVCTGIM